MVFERASLDRILVGPSSAQAATTDGGQGVPQRDEGILIYS